jgi:hypothetical protein
MNTPWGSADFIDNINEDIVQVSTPSHGGIGIEISKAESEYKISDYAKDTAIKAKGYYWFEEDCNWSIAVLELKEFNLFSEGVIEEAINCADRWHNNYQIGWREL